jgi:hypothetical protein
VTDFNGDGNDDVLVGFDNVVRVVLGDGEGNLASASNSNWLIGESGSLTSMAVGDIDEDGDVDLVAHDFTNVKVRLGDGQGGFDAPPGGQSYAAGNAPISVALETSIAMGHATLPLRTLGAATSASSVAAATALSRRRYTSPLVLALLPWQPATSTATAGLTSPRPTQPATTSRF